MSTNWQTKAFQTIQKIKNPLQVVAFIILAVAIVTIATKSTTNSFLFFFIIATPFFLVFYLFNSKNIEKFVKPGKGGAYIIITLIICIIAFASFPIYLSIENSSIEEIENSKLPFAKKFAQNKINYIQKENFLIENYKENFTLLSNYLFSNINNTISNNMSDFDYKSNNLLYQQILEASTKISNSKENSNYSIFGNEIIRDKVAKLQMSINKLTIINQVFKTIYRCYNSNQSSKLDSSEISINENEFYILNGEDSNKINIIKNPPSHPLAPKNTFTIHRPLTKKEIQQLDEYEIRMGEVGQFRKKWFDFLQIEYSIVEKEIIRSLGKEIIFKKIKDLNVADVRKIKQTFSRLGFLNEKKLNTPDTIILANFFNAITSYNVVGVTDKRFYELAYGEENIDAQFCIYISMYDVGLIDFNKFILSYCNEKIKRTIEEILNEELNLFALSDSKKLDNSIKEVFKNKESKTFINMVLKKTNTSEGLFFNDKNIELLISNSTTVEEYIINVLKYGIRKNGIKDAASEFLIQMPVIFETIKDDAELTSFSLYSYYMSYMSTINLIERNFISDL